MAHPHTVPVEGFPLRMTLFLWAMTAYLLAILGLWPLGFGREHESLPRWWAERPSGSWFQGSLAYGCWAGSSALANRALLPRHTLEYRLANSVPPETSGALVDRENFYLFGRIYQRLLF
jgi:hypothetical protein